jgi:lauroyl/myristoyl acyltransferase
MTDRGALIVHRPRRLAPPPAWRKSDLSAAAGLALMLLPSWLLPERLWAPVCRAVARLPVPANRSRINRDADNIQAALGEPDQRRARTIAQDLDSAIYELCLQDLRAWRPGGWRPNIVLEGEDHLQHALSRGKGAILWVSLFVFHSAVTKIALHQRGYRVSHLSSPQHGFSQTRLAIATLNRIRCTAEDRYLSRRIVFDRSTPSTAMRRMLHALSAGEVVSIVATSTEGSGLVEGRIFGGRLLLAAGAPRLAALTGAPLLPVFTIRDAANGFRVTIEAPIEIAADRPTDERCVAAVTEYLERTERWVRKFPEQWRAWRKWRRA